MIKVIIELYHEYGFIGLIFAFIVFYMAGSFISKSFIKWSIEAISTKKLLLNILIVLLSAFIIPFLLGIHANSIGNPIDTKKLWSIFFLKEGGFLAIIIAVFLYKYNLSKEVKLKERIDKLIAEQKRINKDKRVKRKKAKRNEKLKKDSRKHNKT